MFSIASKIFGIPFTPCDFGSNMSDCPLVTQSSEQLWCQDIVGVIAQLHRAPACVEVFAHCVGW